MKNIASLYLLYMVLFVGLVYQATNINSIIDVFSCFVGMLFLRGMHSYIEHTTEEELKNERKN